MHFLSLTAALVLAAAPLGPGDHTRTVQVDGRERSYLVHVPPKHNPKRPAPVVLIFHGMAMNAQGMVEFCGLNKKADAVGFVAVYPNGAGATSLFLTWNSGGFQGPWADKRPNDVAGRRPAVLAYRQVGPAPRGQRRDVGVLCEAPNQVR